MFTAPQSLSELSTVCREVMGLVSMLFEWYKVTATLPNDKSGAKVTNEKSFPDHVTSCHQSQVEKIKSDFLPDWLKKLSLHSPEIFVQCLIPEPCQADMQAIFNVFTIEIQSL